MESKEILGGIKQIEKMEEEVKEWFYYLDSIVGVLSFTLAVTCFSVSRTTDGIITSSASMLFVILVGIIAQKHAGSMQTVKKIRRLRDEYKKNNDSRYQEYEDLCLFVNKHFMRVVKAPIFFAGYSTLSVCFLWNLSRLVLP